MSVALYRRYRPETFQEVIGQEHVTKPLMAALEAGNTTHAYLFSGPRGCGKTTSARILARCLNCAEYPTATPCGKCDSCRELARDGSGSLDVVELDAASHGGVDDARELREQASFAPVRDRFKIFIIDEAHMVSNQGFNALLKLVEEPPEHVKFIFATTEPEKVIGTIRSRTHHYPFRLVPPNTLEDYLEQLCQAEGVQAGKDVLSLVVRAGTGSVRDTLSVLDQIIGGSDGHTLKYDEAVALLGYTSAHLLDETIAALVEGDGAGMFSVVDAAVRSGHDPRRFVEDLLQRLRDLVIIALAGDDVKDVFLSVPDDQYQVMVSQAHALGARRASRAADLTNEALNSMAGATAPRMQLELLCARLLMGAGPDSGQADSRGSSGGAGETRETGQPQETRRVSETGRAQETVSPEQMRAAFGRSTAGRSNPVVDPRRAPMPAMLGSPESTAQPAPAAQSEPVAAPQAPRASAPAPEPEPARAPEPEPVRAPEPEPTAAAVPAGSKEQQLAQTLRGQWDGIVARAGEESKIALNILHQATGPLAVEGGVLLVGFAQEGTAMGFNRNKRAQVALANAVKALTGADLNVQGQVGSPSANSVPPSQGGEPARPKAEPTQSAPVDVPAAISEPAPEADLAPEEETVAEPDLDDIPPEEDPIYGLSEETDESDPAGVLASLIDGTAQIKGGDHTGQKVAQPIGNEPTAEPAANAEGEVSGKEATEPGSENVPFYSIDLPDLPPEMPDFGSHAPTNVWADSPAKWEAPPQFSAGAREEHRPAIHATELAAVHGKPEPAPSDPDFEAPPEFEDEWDEVSADDPEVDPSSIIGLGVVLKTFNASVIEEIPREAR